MTAVRAIVLLSRRMWRASTRPSSYLSLDLWRTTGSEANRGLRKRCRASTMLSAIPFDFSGNLHPKTPSIGEPSPSLPLTRLHLVFNW